MTSSAIKISQTSDFWRLGFFIEIESQKQARHILEAPRFHRKTKSRCFYGKSESGDWQSFILSDPPVITHWASVAGKKESEGPLAHTFDIKSQDTYFGQKTWEQGEKQMQKLALGKLAEKANMKLEDFDLVFSGDLLNQCIGSSFTLRNLGIPHLGLYGACSTMAESLLLSSMAVGGGFADNAVAMTSSPLCLLRAAVPLSPGLRRAADSHRPMDGHRFRGCTCAPLTAMAPKSPAVPSAPLPTLASRMQTTWARPWLPPPHATIKAHFDDMTDRP